MNFAIVTSQFTLILGDSTDAHEPCSQDGQATVIDIEPDTQL